MINKIKMLLIATNLMFSCMGAASVESKSIFTALDVQNTSQFEEMKRVFDTSNPLLMNDLDTTDITCLTPHISLDMISIKNDEAKTHRDLDVLINLMKIHNCKFTLKSYVPIAKMGSYITLIYDFYCDNIDEMYKDIITSNVGYLLGIFKKEDKPDVDFHLSLFKMKEPFQNTQKIISALESILNDFNLELADDSLRGRVEVRHGRKKTMLHARSNYFFGLVNDKTFGRNALLVDQLEKWKNINSRFLPSEITKSCDDLIGKAKEIEAIFTNYQDIGYTMSKSSILKYVEELKVIHKDHKDRFNILKKMASQYRMRPRFTDSQIHVESSAPVAVA